MSLTSELRRTVLAPATAVLLPAYLSACFHYVAADAGWMPAPGTNIRAELAQPQPFNLGTLTVRDVRSIEGTVVETYPDSLGVWVKWLHPLAGARYDANSVQFYLQRGSIVQLEQWRVSGKQTAILLAASAAVVAGLLTLVSLAGGQNSAQPPDGGGPTARPIH